MPNDRRRAWILGAGFSRPLGGPLLVDLLSPSTRLQLRHLYSTAIDPLLVDRVLTLYHYGAGSTGGSLHVQPGDQVWRDPEQFLEYLDEIGTDHSRFSRITEIWSDLGGANPVLFPPGSASEIAALGEVAKRVVCAACSAFLEGVTRETARTKERWIPYLQWLGTLRGQDAIITFNYDRVVELLQPTVRTPHSDALWGVVVDDGDHTRLADARTRNVPVLHKLHGSVNWTLTGTPPRLSQEHWRPELLAGTPAIAVPGDSKVQLSGGAFGLMWGNAITALRNAEDIFIIGFRFPESDAFPRSALLSAIGQNQFANLRIHVILGPDVFSPDAKRIASLLQFAQPTATVHTDGRRADHAGARPPDKRIAFYPMWSQDFLSSWAIAESRDSQWTLPHGEIIC
jgi:hypothetical protein